MNRHEDGLILKTLLSNKKLYSSNVNRFTNTSACPQNRVSKTVSMSYDKLLSISFYIEMVTLLIWEQLDIN